MRGVRAPMFLAEIAVFFNARVLGLPWDSRALRELLGGLFRALRLGRLCRCACFVDRVRNFYALQDQQEGLNSFRVAFFQQMVLVLPLQRAHAQDVARELGICEGVHFLCVRTCAGAVEQAREIFHVVVQLQHSLHKLTNSHLVGLLEAIRDIESQIFSCVM